ncbi:hypothetical protein BpHYR1_051271 [Brachionus plicatilis]|uniref:Uncharacterized protein n=1 Tax=Brachionus plicatilis TaxID=10195 RepID=A0A3M7T947_BRAPC|nr:hypothetical protein BpHYR1_051271 [Brachionus plicatilis]
MKFNLIQRNLYKSQDLRKKVNLETIFENVDDYIFVIKQEIIEPRPILNDHKLEQFSSQQNSKFTDFNNKPRGWGNNPDPNIVHPVNMAIENLSQEINREAKQVPFEHHPNKIDVSGWNNTKNQSQDQHQNYTISKDGIMNLKAKFFESAKNEPKSFDLLAHHQPLKKITSHDQYLFSNKHPQNVLKVALGNNSKSSESPSSNNYSSGYMSDSNNMTGHFYGQHDDEIAAKKKRRISQRQRSFVKQLSKGMANNSISY